MDSKAKVVVVSTPHRQFGKNGRFAILSFLCLQWIGLAPKFSPKKNSGNEIWNPIHRELIRFIRLLACNVLVEAAIHMFNRLSVPGTRVAIEALSQRAKGPKCLRGIVLIVLVSSQKETLWQTLPQTASEE